MATSCRHTTPLQIIWTLPLKVNKKSTCDSISSCCAKLLMRIWHNDMLKRGPQSLTHRGISLLLLSQHGIYVILMNDFVPLCPPTCGVFVSYPGDRDRMTSNKGCWPELSWRCFVEWLQLPAPLERQENFFDPEPRSKMFFLFFWLIYTNYSTNSKQVLKHLGGNAGAFGLIRKICYSL